MSSVSPGFDTLPDPLRGEAEAAWQACFVAGAAPDLHADARVAATLPLVFSCSRFAAEVCRRLPQAFDALLADGSFHRPLDGAAFAGRVEGAVAGLEGGAFDRALRGIRQRETLRIAWRDLAGWSTNALILAELSALADACIRCALQQAEREVSDRHGVAVNGDGETQQLIVLAMGKLGGRELNFSSDIDLVLLYAQPGETAGPRVLSNAQYFTRIAQRLIGMLSAVTEDGFVYRVDTRLRPFGESGALVQHLAAFELYLHEHGREWERYAYVKARTLSGSAGDRGALADMLRPFVYRRYVDYGVLESLREMRDLIGREVARGELSDDVKRGPGGIREIEFIVQTHQLLRGGREPRLQVRELEPALARLGERAFLDPSAAVGLAEAYAFLRRLENRIQMVDDRQLHVLPETGPELLRLGVAMGYADWESLGRELERQRRVVSAQFEALVLGPSDERGGPGSSLAGVWDGSIGPAAAETVLGDHGFEEPARILHTLGALSASAWYARLSERARDRLDRLVPRLLETLAEVDEQSATLVRVLAIVEAVARRSAYFALLLENPPALQHLVRLCAQSPLVARQVAAHPLLLDELLDPSLFEQMPTRADLALELAARFAGVAADDVETQMEALRQFQQAALFQTVVSDLVGALPLMKVSDLLTGIAELVLQQVMDLSWGHLAARHGNPRRDGEVAGFAVIGYGKLGGIELGYGSDLDLVFLHDSDAPGRMSDGAKPLDNGVFFARLASRMMHLLSTQTRAGVLYEVDTRLRPSGRAGLLVSSLSAFESYQSEQAWTWEHQALLRARGVAGDPRVRERFEAIRREILCRPRDPDALRRDVSAMRKRMREELSRSGAGQFDLKQGAGGLGDIEFLVQYLVLREARVCPQLVQYSDNIRQLEALTAAGLLARPDAQVLADAYRAYRARGHRLALRAEPPIVADSELGESRAAVIALWESVLGRVDG